MRDSSNIIADAFRNVTGRDLRPGLPTSDPVDVERDRDDWVEPGEADRAASRHFA